MNTNLYITSFIELIRIDLLIFKQKLFDKCIDIAIWVILTILVMGYILPYFGIAHDFGVFQFGGLIASVGLFENFSDAVDLVSDFEGDRAINYHLTLPIPPTLVFLSKVTYFAIVYSILTIIMFPIGALTLWNQIDLTQINYFKLAVAMAIASIFYGCCSLFISSYIPNMSKIGSVWNRFIFPMWFMGGFQFSWLSLYHVLPWLGIICLINPIMYITEAVRGAILNPADYIQLSLCVIAVLSFSILFLILAIKKLKRRLDFI